MLLSSKTESKQCPLREGYPIDKVFIERRPLSTKLRIFAVRVIDHFWEGKPESIILDFTDNDTAALGRVFHILGCNRLRQQFFFRQL